MSSQRYERVAELDDEDLTIDAHELRAQRSIPNSPPPSFRSRPSSRRASLQHHDAESEADRSLADAFSGPVDDDSDSEDENADSRRLVSAQDSGTNSPARPDNHRRVTDIPNFTTTNSTTGRVYGGGSSSTRDGVFANITAKPQPGDDADEKPPTYEQAAADATPPYWETTILTPGGFNSDDIFVDGLLVGSLFSFVWNALISMSFQLIGFLLTYLLHTTHAAKHGSRAGLGITLIQYGFTMRSVVVPGEPGTGIPGDVGAVPSDPNAHDFDPNIIAGDAGTGTGSGGMSGGMGTGDWLSYVLMIAGWLLVISSASAFIRARRQEALIRASPDRGLPVPIIATGEGENAV